jgi:hypothetical protein
VGNRNKSTEFALTTRGCADEGSTRVAGLQAGAEATEGLTTPRGQQPRRPKPGFAAKALEVGV